jgi:hypothetical protein
MLQHVWHKFYINYYLIQTDMYNFCKRSWRTCLTICALLSSKHAHRTLSDTWIFQCVCCFSRAVASTNHTQNLSHITKWHHLHDFAFLADESWFSQSNLRLRRAKGKISLAQKMVRWKRACHMANMTNVVCAVSNENDTAGSPTRRMQGPCFQTGHLNVPHVITTPHLRLVNLYSW